MILDIEGSNRVSYLSYLTVPRGGEVWLIFVVDAGDGGHLVLRGAAARAGEERRRHAATTALMFAVLLFPSLISGVCCTRVCVCVSYSMSGEEGGEQPYINLRLAPFFATRPHRTILDGDYCTVGHALGMVVSVVR